MSHSQQPIQIWTTQMGQWRKVKEQGIEFIDITVKTGIKEFAPTWDNLMAYKRGELSEEGYTTLYHAKLIRDFHQTGKQWWALTSHPKMAIACYCRPGDFCHRHLFTPLLAIYLRTKGFQVELMGEFTSNNAKTQGDC